jgi:hypothetical protein
VKTTAKFRIFENSYLNSVTRIQISSNAVITKPQISVEPRVTGFQLDSFYTVTKPEDLCQCQVCRGVRERPRTSPQRSPFGIDQCFVLNYLYAARGIGRRRTDGRRRTTLGERTLTRTFRNKLISNDQ